MPRFITPPFLGSAAASGAVTVAGTTATISFTGGTATILQPVKIAATAGTITFTGGAATIKQPVTIAATAGTISFVAGSATVDQVSLAPITVAGLTAEIRFTGGTAVVAQATTIAATTAAVQFVGGTAVILHPALVTAVGAEIKFTAGTAVIGQAETVVANTAEISFTGGSATISQVSGIGGRLIRRRRAKHIYWDEEEELGKLVTLLGRHPTERTKKVLQAEARIGLTEAITAGQPVAISYDDDAMLIELVGQQIKVQGALRKHVEVLIDDEDVIDLIHMIA